MDKDQIVGIAKAAAGNREQPAGDVVCGHETAHALRRGPHRGPSRRLRAVSLVLAVACPAFVMACSDGSRREEANGESAGMRGDWVAATPLFEQAYAAHPGEVLNQFNLATAYQNTGQTSKAIALYEIVEIDGQFTATNLIASNGGTIDPKSAGDLSAEATRRMAIMASREVLLDQLNLLASRNVLPVKEVLLCDFKGRNGNGAGRLGEIVVYVDDEHRTASTLGFFLAAPDQQKMNRFDSGQIVWTQRYDFVGHSDSYRYTLNRATASLDVTRPLPDTSNEAKVTASCHAAAGA